MVQRAQQHGVGPDEQRRADRVADQRGLRHQALQRGAPHPQRDRQEHQQLRHIQRVEDRQVEQRRGIAVARGTRQAPQPQQRGQRRGAPQQIGPLEAGDRPADAPARTGQQRQQGAISVGPSREAPGAFRHVGIQAPVALGGQHAADQPEQHGVQRRQDRIRHVALLAAQQHESQRHRGDPHQPAPSRQRRRHPMPARRNRRQTERGGQRQCGPFGQRPVEPAAQPMRDPRRQHGESGVERDVRPVDDLAAQAPRPAVDFRAAAAQPPQQSPHRRRDTQPRRRLQPVARLGLALQAPAAEHAGGRDQQRADVAAVQHRPARRGPLEQLPETEGHARRQLQQQAGRQRQPALLAHAHPHHGGTLHRPHGAGGAPIERQRNRQRDEDHAQREHRLEQQAQPCPPWRQPGRHGQVERRQRRRAPRHRERNVAHQRGLQTHRHQRCAEHQSAIHVVLEADLAAQRIQQCDARVHQEEQDQERLGARQQRRLIAQRPPCRGDAEGEHEAQQIQHPPGAEPCNGKDARVEQRVVAEQRDMAAGAGRDQDRRQETTRAAGESQRRRVLPDRQPGRQRADQHQQRKRRARRQQRHHPRRREHRQVQHADPAALQHQRIAGALVAQTPPDHEQHDGRQRHAGQAELDRQQAVVRRVFEQEGHPEEQDQDADPHHAVAAQQPVARRGHGLVGPGRLQRWRLRCRPGRRHNLRLRRDGRRR